MGVFTHKGPWGMWGSLRRPKTNTQFLWVGGMVYCHLGGKNRVLCRVVTEQISVDAESVSCQKKRKKEESFV
jgi:hypothetical protein